MFRSHVNKNNKLGYGWTCIKYVPIKYISTQNYMILVYLKLKSSFNILLINYSYAKHLVPDDM